MGKCLHTYDLRKGLNLVFLTRPQTPETITATRAWKDCLLAAWGGGEGQSLGVWVFKRGKKVGQLQMPQQPSGPLQGIQVFGSWIVGSSSRRVEIWKSGTFEHYTTIIPRSDKDSTNSVISGKFCSMPTFLNKIFVGKRDGAVDIWNVSTGKLVYTILPPSSESGAVSVLEPSTALSVLAIARMDGSITLHDVQTDEIISRFGARGSPSVISSISFRTDGLGAGEDDQEQGIMATSSRGSGDVTFWDLSKGGKVKGVLRGAHSSSSISGLGEKGGIGRVEFLPSQAVMVTSGTDNALKTWIFDANSLSSTPRILHSRCGHAAPVIGLRFVPPNSDGADTDGKWLMSAGRDQSLWGWSLRKDGQSTELSQGGIQKKAKKLGLLGDNKGSGHGTIMDDLKAPEIISMACSLNRDGGMGGASGGSSVWTNTTSKQSPADAAESSTTGWESVVTGHRGDKFARTWFWGRKRAGRWAFETGDGTEVTTVSMTACGTFALVGSAGGSITMFNLQSGIQRQKFPSTITPGQARKLKLGLAVASHTPDGTPLKHGPGVGKHRKAVTGIAVDSLNRTVMSCSLDGKIKFWDFLTGHLQDEIDWFPMTAILSSKYHTTSDLLALSCDDMSIRVIDTETKKTVRELWGSLGQISDFSFSNDGRWIIAASMDSAIRVWDLPTGHLINALRLDSPCTALAFSDTGEYLATAHANTVGINLWNNRTLFTHVSTRPLRENQIIPAVSPTTSGEAGSGIIDAAFGASSSSDSEGEEDFSAPLSNNFTATNREDLSNALQTLSLVPKSRWQTLLHLDTIRARNKPTEPPKPPEKAPFFLPYLDKKGDPGSSVPQKEQALAMPSEPVAPRPRITKIDPQSTTTNNHFTQTLTTARETLDFSPFLAHLSSLPPAAADIEIRSLHPWELVPFVEALTFALRRRRDYELVQAWMAVFLGVWGASVVVDDVDDDGGGDGGDGVVGNGVKGRSGGLRQALQEWREVQVEEAKRLGRLVGFCGGVVGFLRSGR